MEMNFAQRLESVTWHARAFYYERALRVQLLTLLVHFNLFKAFWLLCWKERANAHYNEDTH